jgi:RNA polymerase sigma-70 factor (sigma-E family)
MAWNEEFAEYVSARWAPLVRSAVLLGAFPHEAEDLVQTTLMRCYASWSKVRSADNRDAYVYRMLVNAHRTSRKRRWWGERPSSVIPEPSDGADETARIEAADAVERALGHLTEAGRTVVVLRFFGQLSEREIADALNIPTGTVKSRLSRALTQLSGSAELSERPQRRRP